MTDYRFLCSWRIVQNSCRNGYYHIFKVENRRCYGKNCAPAKPTAAAMIWLR
jgi:hypothetical protein